MHLVADAVAGPGEVHAVLARNGLQITVVVRVFKAGLQCVVVDIGDAQLGPDALYAHRFKLEIGHRARRVLRERLVYAQRDLAAGRHIAVQQVGADYFLSKGVTHDPSSSRSCFSLRFWYAPS